MFYSDKLILLNKRLKYNSNHKHKNWIRTLVLEAEAAINQLPTLEQEHAGFQVAHNIKHLFKQHENNNIKQYQIWDKREESHKPITEKLKNNFGTISKADKGNSLIIIYEDKYHEKIMNFISNNNFTTTAGNLTKKFLEKHKWI